VLYVVATPLGNLEDITLRAVRILKDVALIACEDTRRTRHLLQAHGISTPTTSYFEHNEKWKGDRILEVVRGGQSAALVSDAGTPGISDPGFRLVREARAEGLAVIPIPGPSAVVAALSVSGLPSDRFVFVGFLPSRAGARGKALAELAEWRETLVFYESPLRVVATLTEMLARLGDREVFLCREATKMHEEYVRGSTSDVLARLAARPEVKGEIVLVVSGAGEAPPAPAEDVAATYAALVAAGRTRREAVKEAARRHGLPARAVYALVLKDEAGES
jgi:16S rRNA (cytidine1402-2'-O)-methyltransferase